MLEVIWAGGLSLAVSELAWEIEEIGATVPRRPGWSPLGRVTCPGSGSGDPPQEDQEVASAVRPRDQGGVEGDVGGHGWFVAAFSEAAEKLKAGDRTTAFPAASL